MKNKTGQKRTVFRHYQALSRPRKALLWVIISLLVYTLTGFFAIPPLAKSILQKKIPQSLGRACSIGRIEFNPFTLQTVIEDFSLSQKDKGNKKFIRFKRLAVNFEIASVWKKALIIKSITLADPVISCRRNNDLKYSFSDLLPENSAPAKKAPASRSFLFSINNVRISKGAIYFNDLPKHKLHKITRLMLAIPQISNLPYQIGSYIQPDFAATINGTKFTVNGVTKPFASSRETNFEIGIKGINIPAYLGYIINPSQIRLASAFLNIKGRLTYNNKNNKNSLLPRLSFSGLLNLKRIIITDKEKTPYLKIPQISIQTGPSNLLAKEINIVKITIDKPQFTLRRFKDSRIAPLCFAGSDKTTPAKTEPHIPPRKPALHLSVKDFTIHGGTIRFNDEKVSSFTTIIRPLELSVKNFSTIPGRKAVVKISAETESAEHIAAHGDISLYPLRVKADISLKDLKLARYKPYSQQFIIPQLTDGILDVSTRADFSVNNQGHNQTKLTDLNIDLRHLRLEDKHGELLLLPDLSIRKCSAELEDRKAHIGEFKAQNLILHIFKEKNGGLNITHLIKPSLAADSQTTTIKKPGSHKTTGSAGNWLISLNKADLTNAALSFTDNSLEHPATMTAAQISLTLSDLASISQKAKLLFSMRLNRNGRLRGAGSVTLKPLALSLNLTGKLGLTPLQPYINRHLNLIITRGELNIKGHLSMKQKDGKIPAVFTGAWNIANFATIDTTHGNDLIKWSALDFAGFKYRSRPAALNINTITVKNLFSRIEREPGGRLNFSSLLVKSKDRPATPGSPPTEYPILKIGRIVLNKAALEFFDLDINPSYNAVIDDISGTVNGLSSDPDSLAAVKISGKINQHSPMDISGRINPFKKPFYARLNLNFHDIDLSPASPYTGKSIGYTTKKGKLTLNLHYLITNRKIEADNKIFLDQFTLGRKVDSPDAVNLPIHLALALLRNRQGEITLNIPVEGNLDDPEFSVSGVVVKVIFNIITKAVTSPFALLGALIPNGEDLKYISFRPGRAELSAAARKKLAATAKILYERPGLQMDIAGMAAPVQDSKELKDMAFARLLKLEKSRREKTADISRQPARLKMITIGPDEYPKYLKMAYESLQERLHPRSKGEKAWRLIKGIFSKKPKITPEKMALIIRDNITINDSDLRLLAHKRAERVVNYLVNKGGVKPDRLFIIEPRLPLNSDKDKKNSGMQVELVIK
ncbi:DUF748 domain-containing protein [Desulfobacterota bacterium M19]